jgi:serine protease AprX
MRTFQALVAVVVAGTAAMSAAGSRDGVQVASPPAPWLAKVDPWVLATGAAGPTEFLVFLGEQADLESADLLTTKAAKGRYVFDQLTATASRTQGPLLDLLSARGIEHQSFWVANMIWVRGDLALAEELAGRDDVAFLHANPTVHFETPAVEDDDARAPEAIEPGVTKVRAPETWVAGFRGQTVVIGGQDTGYDWDHPALRDKYRGWLGSSANHNFNWHDAIHSQGGVCGANSPEPCDDTNHGTHTMGTMVGDDGGTNQIGVAPAAKWIGCRNMDRGNGTPATYSECFQWFIAPTDLNNQNPNPLLAPHVINNSWGCPPSEGCTDPNALLAVVNNTRAAGILVVVSAGNSGSSCGTVNTPAAIYQSSFSVGATSASTDVIAGFSSRGPVTVDGSNRLKPNVSAPGVSVRSALPGGGYGSMSGTSMAGPHVAGAAALLMSVDQVLKGQVGAMELALQGTATPLTIATQTCGGVPGTQVPNNTYGYGRIDAFEAARSRTADLVLASTPWPARTRVGRPLRHVLTVTNSGPIAVTSAVFLGGLPASFVLVSAVPSQGSCGINPGNAIGCNIGALAAGASVTIQVTGTPGMAGAFQGSNAVSSEKTDLAPSNNNATLSTVVARCAPGVNCP